ncbi:IS3 family transposase [Bacillus tropicus]|uniref:IS3 family transposase n=1 Tax=Bacillus tropicus TaxID=2026188 RepID=UPI00398B6018
MCIVNERIESFFSHVKTENLYFSGCKTENGLYRAIENYMWFYNHKRFQKKTESMCSDIRLGHTDCIVFFESIHLTRDKAKSGCGNQKRNVEPYTNILQ